MFDIVARTSNSPLTVSHLAMPVDAILHLDAQTSNSPARVDLHPAYEGTFVAQSSIFKPTVEASDVEDPANRGRKREVDIRRIHSGAVSGSVVWVPSENRDGKAGDVVLKTSNSPARLTM